MKRRTILLCVWGVFVLASAAHAYVGPGVGITLVGWVLGVAAVAGAALWAVIQWPVRWFRARLGSKGDGTPDAAVDDPTPES